MIIFENQSEVMNLEAAYRGMRNPLDSWERGDSYRDDNGVFVLGENDANRSGSLAKAGTEHRKFLRHIIVSVDITAPRFWWQEFDTYRDAKKNSCSTMHTIRKKEMNNEMFSLEFEMDESDKAFWDYAIRYLELKRFDIINAESKESKNIALYKMKTALPEGFMQKRTVTFDYETILNMMRQRENHDISGWSNDFMKWAYSLPYMDYYFRRSKGENV